ncbi:MAG: NADH:ubiquinone reductase (Na(+)-transporting) subunit C [Bacteroidales bacterium]|nr:NADH:ubiquinone reductase (Na(+)-transporting) subunit C [Bacteroidales bacterium]
MFSNSYIFRFASIMVILVATLLSAAALLLKPMQDRNISIEKMQDILTASNIPANADNAIDLYNENMVQELAVNLSGEVKAVYTSSGFEEGNVRAFDIKVNEALKQIADFRTGKSTTEPLLPVFIIKSPNDSKTYVFPIRGVGLWGPVWGNVALKEDLVTIAGVKFDHKGETPGLGAEISTDDFANQFIGKRIFDSQGNFVSVKVIKGDASGDHEVDAISGGTITSDGVSEMLYSGLENYLPFIKSLKVL